MKNTKCLFPDGQSTEGMVSVSQIQTFMSCPKKWEYGYVENLTPRIERPYLTVGKLCHKGMQTAAQHYYRYGKHEDYIIDNSLLVGFEAIGQEWQVYMNTVPHLNEELPDLKDTLDTALAVFSQAFYEFNFEKYEVVELVKNGQPIPALELHFLVPCAGSKGLHGYIDAIFKEKETGFVWCTDYKFRKTLSPDEEEAVNIQNAVYCHACKKMGIDITGTMTWQHCNTKAADPTILKDGSISRAKIKTTWNHYRDFCLKHSKDPAPYQEEMEQKLSEIKWYSATYEYRNDETIKNMWNQIVVPSAYAIKSAYTKARKAKNRRNLYPWNCKMCQFKDLCQAELRNHDADFLRQTQFIERQKHDKKPVDNPKVDMV